MHIDSFDQELQDDTRENNDFKQYLVCVGCDDARL